MKIHRSTVLALILCSLSLALKIGTQHHIAKQNSNANLELKPLQAGYHGRSLKKYSFGFDNLIADLIWIQLLQVASHEKLKDGKVSWEYAQLEAITTLDPHFEHAYRFGSAFLSVFREDNLGAKLLLEKWVKYRRNLWITHYLLGYHLYFEMNDYAAASKEMLTAASMENAPVWLASLGIRLLSESGALVQALNQSIELYRDITDPIAKFRIEYRVRSLHYTFEKQVWTEALKSYRQKNNADPSTLSELTSYRRDNERNLASVLDQSDLPEKLATILSEKFLFRFDTKTKTILASGDTAILEQTGIFKPHTK